MTVFKKAERVNLFLREALIGPSGTGKTYTALNIASHLAPGGIIDVVDTEKGTSNRYADIFDFYSVTLNDHHPEKYIEAIQAAVEHKCDVLIIDSLTHAWRGKHGGLELHADETKKMKIPNSYVAWRGVTPIIDKMIDAMLDIPCHLIVTMRSKMEYVIDKDENGKSSVRKIGMQPLQRDGVEFEFDVIGDLDQEHNLFISKTRCRLIDNKIFPKPGKEFAEILLGWCNTGKQANKTDSQAPIASIEDKRKEKQKTAQKKADVQGNGDWSKDLWNSMKHIPNAKEAWHQFAIDAGMPNGSGNATEKQKTIMKSLVKDLVMSYDTAPLAPEEVPDEANK